MAPQLKYVSNFRGMKQGPFERSLTVFSQVHPGRIRRLVQTGHPDWMSFELAFASRTGDQLGLWWTPFPTSLSLGDSRLFCEYGILVPRGHLG